VYAGSWLAGLGATLARLREYLLLCSDRAALFVAQDIHLAASAILKMSSGCKVLSNTMNPDALLEEARQVSPLPAPLENIHVPPCPPLHHSILALDAAGGCARWSFNTTQIQ
jgi:hypothetical protein